MTLFVNANYKKILMNGSFQSNLLCVQPNMDLTVHMSSCIKKEEQEWTSIDSRSLLKWLFHAHWFQLPIQKSDHLTADISRHGWQDHKPSCMHMLCNDVISFSCSCGGQFHVHHFPSIKKLTPVCIGTVCSSLTNVIIYKLL